MQQLKTDDKFAILLRDQHEQFNQFLEKNGYKRLTFMSFTEIMATILESEFEGIMAKTFVKIVPIMNGRRPRTMKLRIEDI